MKRVQTGYRKRSLWISILKPSSGTIPTVPCTRSSVG
jgi:hypothetical protein